jgi:hypothetical protein
VGKPDFTRLSPYFEQHQGLPEHPRKIGTVDLLDEEKMFARLGGLVGAEQVTGAYVKYEAVTGGTREPANHEVLVGACRMELIRVEYPIWTAMR